MGSQDNPLQKQLDEQRRQQRKEKDEQKFLSAVSYVEKMAGGPKRLTSSELAYLNQLLTDTSLEPWRLKPVEVEIPSGRKHQFNLISNPLNQARELLGDVLQLAGNHEVILAAATLYSRMVLLHLFNDANRRTAVLATYWLLRSYGQELNATALLRLPIGDLRDPGQTEALALRIKTLVDSETANPT